MIFFIPLAFDAPVRGGGPRRSIAMLFGMEKLEWWAIRWWKNLEDIFNRLHTILGCDGQADRQISCHGIVRAMDTRRAVKMYKTYNRLRARLTGLARQKFMLFLRLLLWLYTSWLKKIVKIYIARFFLGVDYVHGVQKSSDFSPIGLYGYISKTDEVRCKVGIHHH